MKNIIISYNKLPLEVKRAIWKDYPMGIEYELQSIKNAVTGKYFEGLIYAFGDILYLIKVNTIAIQLEEDDEDDFVVSDDDSLNETEEED